MAFPAPDQWQDGIYFGLPEELYHSLPWCGSSNIKELAYNPPDYWAGSAMNPLREPPSPDTAAMRFGTAIHYCILHGEPKFRDRYGYVAGDSGKEEPSAEGLKDWITANGGAPRKLKEDNLRLIWEEHDTILLTEKLFNKILIANTTIKANPHLVQAFSGGFPEVSIFWHEEGVPCKCRIDYLKLQASVDLKSMSGRSRMKTFDRMVLDDIFRNYRYDIQAAHYTDGRLAAAELHKAGKVFVADGEARPSDDWLAKCLGNKEPAWVFVFYKTDGATIAKGYQDSMKGAMMAAGAVGKRTALTNYQAFTERFGSAAWVNDDPLYVLDEEDIPKWL